MQTVAEGQRPFLVNYARNHSRAVVELQKIVGPTATIVYFAYDTLADQGEVKIPGRELAQFCGITHQTFLHAKAALIEKNLLVPVGRSRMIVEDVFSLVRFLDQNEFGTIFRPNSSFMSAGPYVHSNDLDLSFNVREEGSSALEGLFDDQGFESGRLGQVNLAQARVSVPDTGDIESLFADPPTRETRGAPFRLTPPPGPERSNAPVPREKSRTKIPRWAFDKMYKLCFLVTDKQGHRLLTKQQKGNVATVLTNLYLAGADLMKIDEFQRWWARNYRSKNRHDQGVYQPPTPLQVQALWNEAQQDKGMEHLALTNPVVAREINDEAEARLAEAMRRRAERQ
jgi:hypothetical protein